MGHESPEFTDKANRGGASIVITLAAGAIVELKVGLEVLADREFVEFQALDTGIKWGFGDQPGEQPFDCFKSQFFTRPFGPNTSVFLYNSKTTTADIAIGEVA